MNNIFASTHTFVNMLFSDMNVLPNLKIHEDIYKWLYMSEGLEYSVIRDSFETEVAGIKVQVLICDENQLSKAENRIVLCDNNITLVSLVPELTDYNGELTDSVYDSVISLYNFILTNIKNRFKTLECEDLNFIFDTGILYSQIITLDILGIDTKNLVKSLSEKLKDKDAVVDVLKEDISTLFDYAAILALK